MTVAEGARCVGGCGSAPVPCKMKGQWTGVEIQWRTCVVKGNSQGLVEHCPDLNWGESSRSGKCPVHLEHPPKLGREAPDTTPLSPNSHSSTTPFIWLYLSSWYT